MQASCSYQSQYLFPFASCRKSTGTILYYFQGVPCACYLLHILYFILFVVALLNTLDVSPPHALSVAPLELLHITPPDLLDIAPFDVLDLAPPGLPVIALLDALDLALFDITLAYASSTCLCVVGHVFCD